MNVSKEFINLITLFEGLKTKAYYDSGGVATIGIGTIVYPGGNIVKINDVITEEQAVEYLNHEVSKKSEQISKALEGIDINQNQFDAIISLVYNIGYYAFIKSTLLKLIKANPNDPAIEKEWNKWNHVQGKVVGGLTSRRKKEFELYSKK
jgi:lysozyme